MDLQWNAPPECPRVGEVQARIRKLAGSRKSSSSSLRAEASITREEGGDLHLRLLIHAGNLVGERNIEGKSCRDLASATAVNLVLLLNSSTPLNQSDLAGPSGPGGEASPDGSRDGTSPNEAAAREGNSGNSSTRPNANTNGHASPPEPAPTKAGAPPGPAPEASDAGPPRRWHVLLQLPLFELGLGPLRTFSPGVAAAGGASFDSWRFLARAVIWSAQHPSLSADFQQYGGDVDRLTATLLACRALVFAHGELAPCVSMSLEHVSARGTGAHIAPQTATATWLAAGLGLRAQLYVTTWLRLNAQLDVQVETSQPELALGGVGPIEHLLPVAATGTVGPEWIF